MKVNPVFVVSAAMFFFLSSAQAQFQVRTVNSAGTITNIDMGESELASDPNAGTGTPAVINYLESGSSGDFGGDSPFPTGTNADNFAMEAVAQLTFNVSGSYVFQVNSDDGFRLRFNVSFGGSGGTTYSEFTTDRGPGNTVGAGTSFAAGDAMNIRLTYYENASGSEVEFSYSLNSGASQLVGSTADISVAPIPEPGTSRLLAVGAVGVWCWVRGKRTLNALKG
jgi:hypothetical protein